MQEPAIKVIAMPRDANPDGDMFGGWILSMMDLAGAATTRKITRHKVVTVAVDNIIFHNPVFIGDLVECFTTVEKTGRTSMTVKIDTYVERRDRKAEDKLKVTEGRFVYVAIGPDRRPMPLK